MTSPLDRTPIRDQSVAPTQLRPASALANASRPVCPERVEAREQNCSFRQCVGSALRHDSEATSPLFAAAGNLVDGEYETPHLTPTISCGSPVLIRRVGSHTDRNGDIPTASSSPCALHRALTRRAVACALPSNRRSRAFRSDITGRRPRSGIMGMRVRQDTSSNGLSSRRTTTLRSLKKKRG
jgi:hypothetical protein